MPSVSQKQHNFMEMVAHDPKAARRTGVAASVGKDFVEADKSQGKAKQKRKPMYAHPSSAKMQG